ncbi:hypothetical protein ACHAXA_008141 [Cyclostephanos tholiformis]|uniref:Phosphodiesterase n=1 Tax=Cyclostephanos tholiformis TaxID=382380 RepID=A0ABD3SF15_9STRA
MTMGSAPDTRPSRRSSSWSTGTTFSEELFDDGGSTGLVDMNEELADLLTNQRWHEVGNDPSPSCAASSDFDVMVGQVNALLSTRLRDLLVARKLMMGDGAGGWAGGDRPDRSTHIAHPDPSLEGIRYDRRLGNYVLVDSISESMRRYVSCIGGLYNEVGFHSFGHAVHVTVSMNKLLSMVCINRDFDDLHHSDTSNNYDARALPKIDSHASRRRCSLNVPNGVGGEGTYSFGIGEDPMILFAMVFSALIHDVGHKGVPNSVLVEEEDGLAILHNDVSVAEQNSLQVAFSMLQRDEFAGLKRCICPTPENRRFFRKMVISMVMVTDISDQERVQIVASRWNAAFPPVSFVPETGADCGEHGGAVRRHSRSFQVGHQQPHPLKKAIQSTELKAAISRRRFSMFSTDAAVEEFANESRRLGIRRSMDFSGMLLDAYKSVNQLQQHAVLETMMNAADVAHTMQSFRVFVKWNKRLLRELYVAHKSGRLCFDPCENWYENQIGFFTYYILPLSEKMKNCGVFGHTGSVFEYFAAENKKRWMKEGEGISERIIRDVKEEVERGLPESCPILDVFGVSDYAPNFS